MNKPDTRCLLAIVLTASIALVCIAAPALAGGGQEEKGKLEHVVSLEGKSGMNLILARWYNENRLLYALVVTATMAVLGIVVGQVTEWVLKLIGVR